MNIYPIDSSSLMLLKEISIRTFKETFSHSNTPEDMEVYLAAHFSTEQLQSELANPHSNFYFAEINNKVVGYLKLNFSTAQTESFDLNAVEIERIYVLSQFQGTGIGKRLYQHALEFAKQRMAKYLWLGVWEHNSKAIEFYKKNGLEIFDKHIFRLGDDEQTDWLMRIELN
ncbi:N-acetyltransferase [Actinobacillus succinogenes]|uniref:Prolyl aminopeptidase n=1 Tax=Actinobacillus succinogenes (strain ATCC 55618 / DSM 22257 / CCUG 43843 / 130Z) TaxID=339671 RepID=A6VMB5_ACTSZ|nr:GNAT family N-acetyltransferase [Actinobacillus succinogenes]ABR74112.1 Prolyl aminopeptidase [Actinobacillus succinogenes 130Z]PHI39455.1 N-acetyltransferase [Actinobacillus succinogenes]